MCFALLQFLKNGLEFSLYLILQKDQVHVTTALIIIDSVCPCGFFPYSKTTRKGNRKCNNIILRWIVDI